MEQQQLLKIRIYFTGVVTFTMLAILMWQSSHQGVPNHHLLQRADYPAISNWWGVLVLPFLSWVLIGRIHRQSLLEGRKEKITYPIHRVIGFSLALFYGGGLSVAFAVGYPDIAAILFQGILAFALFFKIYREEHILGFILGMCLVFGAVLPTLFATIIALASAIVYHSVHYIFNHLKNYFKAQIK